LLHAGDFSDNREAVLKFGNLHSNHISHLMPFSVIPLIFQNRCSVPVDQASESLLKSKACFGAENLMRVLGNYCRLGEVRTHIRVGVVGKASGEVMGPRLLPCAGASLGERILGTSCYFWLGRRSCSGRVLLFFFKVFIYFGSTGFLLLHGLSLIVASGGYSLVEVLGFLIMVGSLIVEHGL